MVDAGLAQALGIIQADRVAIIGSGGKTGLLWYLAGQFRSSCKVLVTTTTKILVPDACSYDFHTGGAHDRNARPGVTLAGIECGNGKMSGLEPFQLEALQRQYDVVLMECDGARMKPLKGWAANEPVVPAFTTAIVSVIPLWPLGYPVTVELIHRLDEFLQLAKGSAAHLEAGCVLRPEHLAAVVANGLLRKAAEPEARQILFFSQIETAQSLEDARAFVKLLPDIDGLRIVAGSSVTGRGSVLSS